MAVSLYFGLPGAGKTTIMAAHAKRALRKKSPYKHVFSNVKLNLNGLIYIENKDIGTYQLEDGLLLIDEATLEFDSRDYKNFSKRLVTFFLLHRHYNVDIELFTQQWDGVDRKIRVITDRVFYIYKGIFTGHWFSRYYRVPYGIIIPDPKNSSEKLGEIIQGYAKPGLIGRIFGGWIFRPKYYKLFDSWEAPRLPDLPRGRTYENVKEDDLKPYLLLPSEILEKEREAL